MTKPTISPEAAALLNEVADDPELAIRKLARYTVGARRFRRGAGLAARHLSEAFRLETARILARHAQEQQFRDPYWKGYLHRSLRAGEELRIASRSEIADHATRLLRSEKLSAEEELFLQPLLGAGHAAFEAAQASLRILDTDVAMILLTYEYMRLEEWESCRRSLERSLAASSCSLNRSIALEQAGMLMIRRGRIDGAIDAYEQSADAEPGRPFPLFFASLLCRLVGSLDRGRTFAERGEELVDEEDSSVDACIHAFMELRNRNVLSREFRFSLRSGELVVGPATARISNALP